MHNLGRTEIPERVCWEPLLISSIRDEWHEAERPVFSHTLRGKAANMPVA